MKSTPTAVSPHQSPAHPAVGGHCCEGRPLPRTRGGVTSVCSSAVCRSQPRNLVGSPTHCFPRLVFPDGLASVPGVTGHTDAQCQSPDLAKWQTGHAHTTTSGSIFLFLFFRAGDRTQGIRLVRQALSPSSPPETLLYF